MTKSNTRYITLFIVSVMLLTLQKAQAQCAWQVAAVSDPSTCSANGRITASLTGADAGNITNVLYRLQSLTSAFNVPQTPANIFQNIPAGQYKVVASGICNGSTDSVSINVTVDGNYIPPTVQVSSKRSTLNGCNSGQIEVSVTNGSAPYTINITSAPGGYTGPPTFSNAGFVTVLDNLNKGTYTISVVDACNTTTSTASVTISELPALNASQFQFRGVSSLDDNSCNRFIAYTPQWFVSGQDYNSQFTYSMSYDGGPQTAYIPLSAGLVDTVILPAGQQLKNTYGKAVTYHIKSPCGQELIQNVIIQQPSLSYSQEITCLNNFNLIVNTFAFQSLICYPAYISLKNAVTSEVLKDTISLSGVSANFTGIPFGTYTLAWTDNDGDTIYKKTNLTATAPNEGPNPYSISVTHNEGNFGNNRAAAFRITKPSGLMPVGTTVELISPANYTYFATLTTNASVLGIVRSQAPNDGYFFPGTYKFRVTDGCSHISYDLDIIAAETDVYSYNWSYTEALSCDGKTITPSGTALYNNISRNVYFWISSGPAGYNDAIVPNNTPLLLPNSGAYSLLIGASSFLIDNYGSNITGIQYNYEPLAVDINHTYGWICPGLPADSGYIRAAAMNGRKGAASVYTYKLAAAGQGAMGPYLATNNTGNFSTSASGGAYTLTKDQNYDIWMGDECGSSLIQTVKIVDFATAELASSDKAEYCLGDEIHFSIINLPSSAIQYLWTGPDNFSSTIQNPVVSQVQPTTGGNYHVTISSDICRQPIEADVNIILAAYVTSCYSAVTDTSVNPYAYGLLGNWRPSRAYTYYSTREQSDPDQQTNIRKDGAFNDFLAFWKKETSGWKPQRDNANWVWNTETTVFNKKGFELENKDPLGRYNAGIYGYDNAVPVAVIQNSRYSESAYEGFEDYGFGGDLCDDACPPDRRFYLSGSDTRLDSTEKHTGRYSLRVTHDDGDGIALKVPVTATATDPADPVFNMVDNDCAPFTPVLKSVKATKNILIPPFSLLSGKKVLLSAWVKEAQDCKCTAYTGNDIKLVVKGTGGSIAIVAHPSGGIIDGWQRYEQVVDLPPGTDSLSIILQVTGTATVFFDDIRLHPYNANMKSFVYDRQSLRLMAELDENNYATFYEYDDDGTLTRLKKETERGIKTIKETRSALIKEQVDEDPNIQY
ncbi:hypothetical protein [Chitinophaga sp. GbtcB8]|uniref:hypothetical protein n=1 Tax=Chitinophaga sp. GbtcB8 TaxID=2824753 RepID=UPI001C2FF05D|nr:hypothetical protein [Chitinophaga sp. GbtcB8]